jgi:hypothetical protein
MEIGSNEDQTVIGRSGSQAELRAGATVQADPFHHHSSLHCSLFERVAGHDVSRPP